MIERRDFGTVTIIGVAIGVLAQPVLTNVIPVVTPALRAGVFFGAVLLAPFALFIAYLLGKIVPSLYQFAKFGAVGTLNSFIDFAVLNVVITLTGITAGFWYAVFKSVSFLCATTNSFLWNRWWTFGQSQTSSAQTVQFYGVALVGWVINVGVASFVVNVIGIPAGISLPQWANIGAFAGVAASFLFNFFGYKLWVFRRSILE